MTSKSDKGYIFRWVVACLIVICIFHFSWAKYLFQNWDHNFAFTMVDALLFAIFCYSGFVAIINADDPNKEGWRYVFIITTLASSAWAAGWSVALMNTIK
jgi:hypothetical protein